jgi:hypothetical protein
MKRTSRICAEGRMRRFRVVAAMVAVIALAAESASASSQKTWINASGCASPGFGLVWAQHPARIGVTCDPHDQIVGARWRNWGQANTQATATLAVDNCNPSCATGRVRRYAITHRKSAAAVRAGCTRASSSTRRLLAAGGRIPFPPRASASSARRP